MELGGAPTAGGDEPQASLQPQVSSWGGDGDEACEDPLTASAHPGENEEKALASPLQVFDAKRTRDLLRAYSVPGTATVVLRVADGPSTYSTLTRLTLRCHQREFSVRLYYPLRLDHGEVVEHSPVTFTTIECGSDEATEIAVSELEGVTTVQVVAPDSTLAHPAEISMELDSCFLKQPFSGFADHWNLGLVLEISGAERILVHLDHPEQLALRARMDNSEYHSLAQAVGPSYIRKLGFFPGPRMVMSYKYGLADQGPFVRLARLPFAASLGCFSAGLTVAFVNSGHGDLAATTLAFALVPPLAQVIVQGRSQYRSADIHDRAAAAGLILAPSVLYIPVVVLTLLSIIDWPNVRAVAQACAYLSAVLLAIHGTAVLGLVKQQVIPEHFCDACGGRIVWRRRQFLEVSSRRTLCKTCARERGVRRVS